MKMPEYKKILYATDQGQNMRPVFCHAISLAQHYQAEIIMCHIVEPIGATGQAVLDTYLPKKAAKLEESGLKKILKVMKKRLEDFYQDELGDDEERAALVSDLVVVQGHAAQELDSHARKWDVDLIVIGTHTDPSLAHAFLGSTARKLVHIADRPVLVIPVASGK